MAKFFNRTSKRRNTLMRPFITAVALAAAPLASHAQAISFEGATISYEYAGNQTYDYDQDELSGSVEIGFGPQFSVQADLATWNYDYSSDDYISYGLHLIYDVSASTSVGAFYVKDDWDPSIYTMVGLEAKHSFGADSAMPLEIEAFYGRYDYEFSGYTFDVLSVDADWAVGSGFSLNGGFSHSDGDEEAFLTRIGAEYALAQGPRIGLGYEHHSFDNFDQEVFHLTLAYDLQGGVTFKQRKWIDVFPGF
jgi:hypothetical protein